MTSKQKEFGSVYESLLELIPQLHTEGQWRLNFLGDAEDEQAANGHARKLSGSYYTPLFPGTRIDSIGTGAGD